MPQICFPPRRDQPIRRLRCTLALLLCGMFGHGQAPKTPATAPSRPIANFTDIAEKAGLTMENAFGGVNTKKYIIETTGTGVAIMYFLVLTPPKAFSMVSPAFSAMSVKLA